MNVKNNIVQFFINNMITYQNKLNNLAMNSAHIMNKMVFNEISTNSNKLSSLLNRSVAYVSINGIWRPYYQNEDNVIIENLQFTPNAFNEYFTYEVSEIISDLDFLKAFFMRSRKRLNDDLINSWNKYFETSRQRFYELYKHLDNAKKYSKINQTDNMVLKNLKNNAVHQWNHNGFKPH